MMDLKLVLIGAAMAVPGIGLALYVAWLVLWSGVLDNDEEDGSSATKSKEPGISAADRISATH